MKPEQLSFLSMSHGETVVRYWHVVPTHLGNWELDRQSHTQQIYWLSR